MRGNRAGISPYLRDRVLGKKHSLRSHGFPSPAEEGTILLLVLWIMALMSVVILSWAQEWRMEIKLAANFREDHQCRRLAEGGIYYALGKIVEAKLAEQTAATSPEHEIPPGTWRGDQSLHTVEFPTGEVRVRVEDEAGKINLNLAQEKTLGNFFNALGYPEDQVRIMVESLLDWRSQGNIPRPYGAKSSYYLNLEPPYPARNGNLDTVEELAWVRGFRGSAMLPRLSRWFTVQETGGEINLNAAPLEVLQSLGLGEEQARQVIQLRQAAPLRQMGEVPELAVNPQFQQILLHQNLGFQSSPFYTIMSTGILNHSQARHTIKAVVRLNLRGTSIWDFLYWADDYPGEAGASGQ